MNRIGHGERHIPRSGGDARAFEGVALDAGEYGEEVLPLAGVSKHLGGEAVRVGEGPREVVGPRLRVFADDALALGRICRRELKMGREGVEDFGNPMKFDAAGGRAGGAVCIATLQFMKLRLEGANSLDEIDLLRSWSILHGGTRGVRRGVRSDPSWEIEE